MFIYFALFISLYSPTARRGRTATQCSEKVGFDCSRTRRLPTLWVTSLPNWFKPIMQVKAIHDAIFRLFCRRVEVRSQRRSCICPRQRSTSARKTRKTGTERTCSRCAAVMTSCVRDVTWCCDCCCFFFSCERSRTRRWCCSLRAKSCATSGTRPSSATSTQATPCVAASWQTEWRHTNPCLVAVQVVGSSPHGRSALASLTNCQLYWYDFQHATSEVEPFEWAPLACSLFFTQFQRTCKSMITWMCYLKLFF